MLVWSFDVSQPFSRVSAKDVCTGLWWLVCSCPLLASIKGAREGRGVLLVHKRENKNLINYNKTLRMNLLLN